MSARRHRISYSISFHQSLMGSNVEIPPYGRRLAVHVVDERARNSHQRPFAAIPRSHRAEDGFEDISYARFANAVNRCSRWINKQWSQSTQMNNSKTVAYIGPQDLRYHILALALLKSGFEAFFPSPRNPQQAFDALFEATKTECIISPAQPLPIVPTLVERRSLAHWTVPSLDELLDPTTVPSIAFNGTFEEYRFKPWVYLHTSGSTGIPKIVPIKHGHISVIDAYNLLDVNEPFARYGNMRTLIPFPSFHIAGLNYGLPVMCWLDSTVVMPLPGIPTAEMCHAVQKYGNVEYSVLPPSIITDLAKEERYLKDLARLNGIAYAGGPVGAETARKVTAYTSLVSTMGATEYGGAPVVHMKKEPEDANYIAFDTKNGGMEFRQVEGQPDLFELVFVRQTGLDLFQSIFVTFPDLEEYHTMDCFSPHPTAPGLWKYEARLDDVIVLSNGEKINPVMMEGIINSCPEVRGCLVVGQGRFQTALVVEPASAEVDIDKLLEAIQPYIVDANKHSPTYGRLTPNLVLVTTAEKPFARAAKGTIQRAPSVALYEPEIEKLYNPANGIGKMNAGGGDLDLSTAEATQTSLLQHISNEMGISSTQLNTNDDLFAMGMDSLQVLGLVRAINRSLPSHRPAINAAFVYEHPTIEKLAAALSTGAVVREYSDFGEDDDFTKQTWEAMEATFQQLRLGGDQKRRRREDMSWPAWLRGKLKSHATPPLYQPDGGRDAWLQVLGSFLVNVNNWGIVNSFGAYQAFYAQDLLSTHSPAEIAWIGTVQGTLLLAVGVIAGPLFDRGYFRSILVLAGFGVVFGLMMLSLARLYYAIMLAQGVLIGLCLGLLYIPSIALIPLFFKRKRGLALGVATAGGSFGGVIYPIIFRRLLSEVGFGWANRVMGFVALTMLIAATMLLRPVGARAPRSLVDTSALREPPYVCFAIAGFVIFAGVLAPFFLAPTFASDILAAPQDLSFYLLSLLNGAQFMGRILPAILSDWIGPEVLLVSAQVSAGALAFAWIAVNSTAGFVVWVIFFGFVSGMVVTLPAAVLPFLCPSMSVLGTRLGMVYAVAGGGFLISTPVALSLTENSQGVSRFLGPQVWIGACCIVASIFCAVSAREVWQKRRLYERNVMHSSNYLFRSRRSKGKKEALAIV